MELYFITLIPPSGVEQQVKNLKLEILKKYGAKNALKLPAHITLQIPFRMQERREGNLHQLLSEFVQEKSSFQVDLSGFGSFAPFTIYVEVANPEQIAKLHEDLKKLMSDFIPLKDKEKPSSFHPHMTIGSRLKKEQFKQAWQNFKNREFSTSFQAEDLYLLKHNGKTWDILEKFPLDQSNQEDLR